MHLCPCLPLSVPISSLFFFLLLSFCVPSFLHLFLDRVLCIPDWSQISYISEDNFLISESFISTPSMQTSHFLSELLGPELRVLGTLVKHVVSGTLIPSTHNQLSLDLLCLSNFCLHLNNHFSTTVLGLTCSQFFKTLRCIVTYSRTSVLFVGLFLMRAYLPTTLGNAFVMPHRYTYVMFFFCFYSKLLLRS